MIILASYKIRSKVVCTANTLVAIKANVWFIQKEQEESTFGVERSLIRIPYRYNPLEPMVAYQATFTQALFSRRQHYSRNEHTK